MQNQKTTKISHKKIFLLIGIGVLCAVLLKRDSAELKA